MPYMNSSRSNKNKNKSINVNNSKTFVKEEMKDADNTGHIQDRHGLDKIHIVEGDETLQHV